MPDEKHGFIIDGELHEFPTLDSLDLDEAEILYIATGWGLEDFVFDPDDENSAEVAKRVIRPTTLKALARIAFRRANPEMDDADVIRISSKANASGMLNALFGGAADDPPAEESTSEHKRSSERSSVDSNTISGNGSSTSSVEPEDDPLITATPVSPTLSLATREQMPAA